MTVNTQVPVSKKTRARLRQLSYKSETYDQLINRIIDFEQKFSNERHFHRWVKNNYQVFGFDEVIDSHMTRRSPDLIVKKNGEIIRVELEVYASNFIYHGHDPSQVDMVICLLKDVELPVKTLEIENFYCPSNNMTTVGISYKTKNKLDLIKVHKRETYDDTINRLLEEYENAQKEKTKRD